ncbi:MAG: ribosomal-protein-alanine N-acetyltransferase [Candidatus Azotimanducaceae bacterium]|jgi:ribosomal-protein-alanine N-acetyltransferase
MLIGESLPREIKTQRLVLRRPQRCDAAQVHASWASDPEAAKHMSWARHTSLELTEQVIDLWLSQWEGTSGGVFLITDAVSGEVIGSTGFELENPFVASTGYILAKQYWGKGFATEALDGIVNLARERGLQRLFAHCHYAHEKSAHVMEKCGFAFEGRLRNYMEFPNLSPGKVTDVLLYAWIPTLA